MSERQVQIWNGKTFVKQGFKSTLTKIGHNEGLHGKTLKLYVEFMYTWWGERKNYQGFDPEYAAEWAARFRKKSAYAHADSITRGIMKKAWAKLKQ